VKRPDFAQERPLSESVHCSGSKLNRALHMTEQALSCVEGEDSFSTYIKFLTNVIKRITF